MKVNSEINLSLELSLYNNLAINHNIHMSLFTILQVQQQYNV